MKRYIIIIALGVFVGAGMFSCAEMDDPYRELIVPNGIFYPAKVREAKVKPGFYRAAIDLMPNADLSVVKARIYWNNYTEWAEFDIPAGADSVRCEVDSLSETTYTFMIHTRDINGNESVPTEASGSVYGDLYAGMLYPRSVASSVLTGQQLAITWQDAQGATMLYSTVSYTDHTNPSAPVRKNYRVQNTQSTTILTGVKSGESFSVVSVFLPEKGLDPVESRAVSYHSE
ncbi:MAG: DUF4998 domain-containing protein [Bacteroidales bacterium]|jgi:hypothetical protein|nr:DUF4998 domain-containing protein [Bacteroidales bacterium]